MEGGARSNSGNRIRWALLPRRGRVRADDEKMKPVLVIRHPNYLEKQTSSAVSQQLSISISIELVEETRTLRTRHDAGVRQRAGRLRGLQQRGGRLERERLSSPK